MKLYRLLLIVIILSSCKERDTLPTISIVDFKNVTHNSIFIDCTVQDWGETWLQGAYMEISSDPSFVVIGDSIEAFRSSSSHDSLYFAINELKPNTKYYFRPKLSTSSGKVTGSIQSCETKPINNFIDIRDDQDYPCIQIGNNIWMAQNLNYNDPSSYSYNNSDTIADIYGRLYTYQTALDVCPTGWHLPDDNEWKELELELGMGALSVNLIGYRGSNEAKYIKMTGEWHNSIDLSLNTTGFSATPAGIKFDQGDFYGFYNVAIFWTSSTYDPSSAYVRELQAINNQINRMNYSKDCYFSVRCVKD